MDMSLSFQVLSTKESKLDLGTKESRFQFSRVSFRQFWFITFVDCESFSRLGCRSLYVKGSVFRVGLNLSNWCC